MKNRPRIAAGLAIVLLLAALWAAAESTEALLPSEVFDSALAERLAEGLRSRALHPRATGIEVLALPDGRRVFSRNARRPLRPASTLKILTGAAALSFLKPEFVFETGIYADAPIDGSGTLPGNLYLKGSGAPDLVGESWWLMVRRLAALGLRRIEGNLVADDSYFDAADRPPGWPPASTDAWYNAPVGALSCNFNVVTVRVEPAAGRGEPPDLSLEPVASYFRVWNRARTDTRPTALSVARHYEDGRNNLVVEGSIRHDDAPALFRRAVEDPALYALHAFREVALGEGIVIAGRLERGKVPDDAIRLHRHTSKPLAVLVRDMNKHSNNFMAEALLKTLGARVVEPPGTTEKGAGVVRRYVNGLGVDTSRARFVDGSGLSDRNRLSARLLAETLARVYDDFRIGPELIGSLSVGGSGRHARREVRIDDLAAPGARQDGSPAGGHLPGRLRYQPGRTTLCFLDYCQPYARHGRRRAARHRPTGERDRLESQHRPRERGRIPRFPVNVARPRPRCPEPAAVQLPLPMPAMIESPNSEHLTVVAPSIWRARS